MSHVYSSNGASRDPECRICGAENPNNNMCFESAASMALADKVAVAFNNGVQAAIAILEGAPPENLGPELCLLSFAAYLTRHDNKVRAAVKSAIMGIFDDVFGRPL